MSNYEFEIEQLNFTLEHELSMKKNISRENEEIEKNLNCLEEQIASVSNDPNDCDWGRKYLAQSEINEELLRQIDLMREKMKQLAEIEPNETEFHSSPKANDTDLRNLLRQLEKEKRNFEGNLRDVEWRLDSESQELFRINEEKAKYKLELNKTILDGKQSSMTNSTRGNVSPLPGVKFSNKSFNHNNVKNRHYGIPDNHRILDARKGPVKKTAAVKILPKIQAGLPNSADSALDKTNKKRHSFKKNSSFDGKDTRNGASTN
ncbi:coiled-coil domain-containing protein 169-like [Clytia hemisphaerica]|uniref:Uncharacterized protein n=1 Tax=Clytia hemisphaerica TaxID=252671 RepID=A0A7M5X9Q1_9CNID